MHLYRLERRWLPSPTDRHPEPILDKPAVDAHPEVIPFCGCVSPGDSLPTVNINSKPDFRERAVAKPDTALSPAIVTVGATVGVGNEETGFSRSLYLIVGRSPVK